MISKEKAAAEQYAFQLLQSRDSISSEEIPLENDNNYFLSILLIATYHEETSPYILTIGEGQVKKGRYSIPNIIISHR